MATVITDVYDKISINDGSTYLFSKSNITDIRLNRKKGIVWINLKIGSESVDRLKVTFSDVTSPTTLSDAYDLYKLLRGYWNGNNKNYVNFYAAANQKIFDTSPQLLLSDSYKVKKYGEQIFTGFTRSGNVITFTEAPGEGALITIES